MRLTLPKSVAYISHQLLPRLIKAAGSSLFFSRFGRYCGLTLGWPLPCGYSIIIENSNEWIQKQLLATGVYEPNVVNVLMMILKSGDLFFDVGANIGYHTLVAASCGARIHSFEPVPRLAKRLEDNLCLNHLETAVTVVQMALSNKTGLATLYVAERDDDGSHSLLSGVPARSIDPIAVRTNTLDRYIEQTKCGVPTVIKVDVEGCEALVLDGSTNTLSAPQPPIWVLETADRLANQLGESATTVLHRLFSRGYRVFRIPDYRAHLFEVSPDGVSGDLANYLAIHKESPRLNFFLARMALK